MKKQKKVILDVTCGSRMMWFDKKHSNVLYGDNRVMEKKLIWEGIGAREGQKRYLEIRPDKVIDFRDLDFPNNSFKLVVFDPPHIKHAGKKSWLYAKYGALTDTWKEDLQKGFSECWRVLDDYGVLIFKWNEESVTTSEVIRLFPEKPLFGHPTSKHGKTKWMTFMKFPLTVQEPDNR